MTLKQENDQKIVGWQEGFERVIGIIKDINKPTLLAIAGGSCSGKSYLNEALLDTSFNQFVHKLSSVPLDNFFRDIDDPNLPKNEEDRRVFDVPNSYHHQEYLGCLKMLLKSEDVLIPKYDIRDNKRILGQTISVEARPVIVTEGLFTILLASEIPNAKRINVFVEADDDTRLQRKIARDTKRYGISQDKVTEIFHCKVLPYHNMFVQPQINQAHLVIISAEGGVLK